MERSYTISPSSDSTIAVEIWRTAFTKRRKHVIFFEGFDGELRFTPEQTGLSEFGLTVRANTAVCHDKWLLARKRKRLTSCTREIVLAAHQYPNLRFTSGRVSTKQLRGFAIEGELRIREVVRTIKVNVVLRQIKEDVQIDGDSTFRLSDFGIKPPRRLFGLIRMKDEVLVRLLLWARRDD